MYLYLALFVALVFLYYWYFESSVPHVIASPDNPILKHDAGGNATFLSLLSHRYYPTYWLPTGHLQTIFTAFGANQLLVPTVYYHREPFVVRAVKKVESPHKRGYYDGQVSLDWCIASSSEHSPLPIFVNNDMKNIPPTGISPPPQPYRPPRYAENTPTCIILHGLAGGSTEPYVIRYVQRLHSHHGWRCVVFNARACGGQELVSPQGYCGSYTDDIRQAVKSIHQRFPKAPLLGVGFSLGANILTKFVGEEGTSCLLTAAVVCANPFDLLHNSRVMHHSWWRKAVYSKALGESLIALFKRHQHQFTSDPRIDVKQVLASRSIREFDIAVTCKLFNYETVDEYYRDGRSAPYVLRVGIPFLAMNALDDPICRPESLPIEEIRYNPKCIMVVTKSGGHSMDWYEGLRARSWSVRVADAFFTAVINRQLHQQTESDISSQPCATAQSNGRSHPNAHTSSASSDSSSSSASSSSVAGHSSIIAASPALNPSPTSVAPKLLSSSSS